MFVRRLLPLVGMAVVSFVNPVAAASGPDDIALFRQIAVESVEKADDDSTSKRPFFIIAGGAGIGFTAYILGHGNAPTGGLPFSPQDSPSGGVLLPPQDFTTPPANQPIGGTTSGSVIDETTTVTPEPATMALLASGLGGLGGMTLRRRVRRP